MTAIPCTDTISPEQAPAILAELDAVLTSDCFSGSKRCQDFLEFVVRQAIAGDYESLTERFLGAKLFGRPVDYETATDSIVRVRASDVRRRLAQHYSVQPSISGVTIEMASGHYIPEFRWSVPENQASSESFAISHLSVGSAQETVAPQKKVYWGKARSTIWPTAIALSLLILTGVLVASWVRRPPTPDRALELFWQPLIHNKRTVNICFGENVAFGVSPNIQRLIDEHRPVFSVKNGDIVETKGNYTSVANIRAAFSIVGLLDSHRVASAFRWPQDIQRAELDRSNVIYIGAYDNPWTLDLNRNLRFAFERANPAVGNLGIIHDQYHPEKTWPKTNPDFQQVDYGQQDYAVITRILDPERNRVVISIGGIGRYGTQAAGEFLADGAALSEFSRNAPKDWERKNIQIVLQMEVSENNAISPKIVATNIW